MPSISDKLAPELENVRFLTINVSERGFGIPIHSIREIVYHSAINPLPQTPDYVRGVTLVREETLPVLDLQLMLGGNKKTPIHDESCFIIVQISCGDGKTIQVCLLADQILHTYKFENQSIDTPPVVANETVIHYILGIARIEEQIFVLIDPTKLLLPLVDSVDSYLSDTSDKPDDSIEELADSSSTTITKNKFNKFLSVFVDEDEYAFPLSSVSQVINETDLNDAVKEDVPDVLYTAGFHNHKFFGVVKLNNILNRNEELTETEEKSVLSDSIDKRNVIVLIEFKGEQLGIIVDRIGKTHETNSPLKQNAFCTDLNRERISSLGFIDNDKGSIEVIEPIGLLTDDEQNTIRSWHRCMDRMMDMSETEEKEHSNNDERDDNPLYQHAGSYLVVNVGEELVAFSNNTVDEVLSYSELLQLNSGPAWFPGLLDLREKTYPVIDMRVKLDIDATDAYENSRKVLVMIKHEQEKIGLVVDQIVRSTQITAKQLLTSEKSTLYVQPQALHATAESDDGLINIINLDYIIEEPEISARRIMNELKATNS